MHVFPSRSISGGPSVLCNGAHLFQDSVLPVFTLRFSRVPPGEGWSLGACDTEEMS